MNLYSLQVYILGSLGSWFPLASPMSLDMYCAEVTGGRYWYSSHTALQKYFRICRDVATYFNCFDNYRTDIRRHPDLVVMPYERSFPKLDDLKRATYWFCMLDLFEIHKIFNYKNITCETQIRDAGCHEIYETPAAMSRLQVALSASHRDEKLVTQLSCSIAAQLTVCIQEQYLACSKDFDIFKQYELARLGSECLQSQQLVSSYTHTKLCASSATHSSLTWLTHVVLPVVVLAVYKQLWDVE